jgi:type II secretory pathway pseudopilin PulG
MNPITPSHSKQRGFTMALLLAFAVIMGILLLKAIPPVTTEVQRENEAELIYRGESIANALRIYFAKSGRYPQDLDELLKVRPAILRQKYKDPMTRGGEWEYIYQVQPGVSGSTQGLPIVGVRSKSERDSFRVYQNKTLIHDWAFVADQNLLGLGGTNKPGQGGSGVLSTGSEREVDPPPPPPSTKPPRQ